MIPLSVMQEALWVAWQLRPGDRTDLIGMPLEVTGEVDLDRLAAAVVAVGRRFPPLRARVEAGEPPVLRWDADDLALTRRIAAGDHDTEVARSAHVPFDLRVGPLARFELVESGDRRTLVVALHHVVGDGHSVLALVHALSQAYGGADLGPPDDPAAATAFARRQRDLADGPEGAAHRAFWRDHLGSEPPALTLAPGRAGLPPHTTSRPVPGEPAAALRPLAASLGVSRFAVLFAAYLVALHRHTGDTDLVVSFPTHPRRAVPELRDAYGFFTNAVPVRVRLAAGERFADLVRRVDATLRDCLRFADLPQPAILRAAGVRHEDVARSVGQAVFQYWDTTVLDGVDVLRLPLRHGDRAGALRLGDMLDVTGYRLQAMLRVDRDGLSLLWKDPGGTVGGDVVDALAETYLEVLAEVVAEPGAVVAGVDLSGAEPLDLPLPPPAGGGSTAPVAAAAPEVLVAALVGVLSWYCGTTDVVVGVVGEDGEVAPLRVDADPAAGFGALTERVRAALRAPRLPVPFHRLDVLVDPDGRGAARPHRLRLVTDRPRLVGDGGVPEPWLRRLAAHLARFAAAGGAEPDRPVGELDPLTDEERRLELVEWNDTAAPHDDRDLVELFRERVALDPDRPAVTDAGRELSYRELLTDAERVAAGLLARGVRPGDFVGVQLPRGLDQVRAVLGVLRAGAAYLPLDPAAPVDRRAFLVADARADLVIAAGDVPENAVAVAPADLLAGEPVARPPAGDPGAPAYCIYTSGTTGRPKGVPISHRAVVGLVRADIPHLSSGPGDTWALCHAAHFDFSVWELFGALLSGARLVVVPEDTARDAERLLDLLAAERVTVLNQTPTAFHQLAEVAERRGVALPDLRYVIFGGERLEPARLAGWARRSPGVALVNMYGITETTVHSTVHLVGEADLAGGASVVGRPLPNTTVHLVDRVTGRRLVPRGCVGEIAVGGSGVARGYLRRPALTAARFLDDPFGAGRVFLSGDLGRRLPDGSLEVLGRADDQVKLRGHRLEPGEVAAALRGHPAVLDAVVLLVGGSEGRLVAFVRTAGDADPGDAALRAHLAALVPPYAVPGEFRRWSGPFPVTRNGKLDRKALTVRRTPAPAPEPVSAPDGDGLLGVIAGLWAELLDVPPPPPSASFFELGGHSLQAGRVALRLGEVIGVPVPLRTVLEHPVQADLAEAVRELARRGAATGGAGTGGAATGGAGTGGAAIGGAGTGGADISDAPAGPAPASAFQERIRLAARVDPDAHRYLVPLLWSVEGDLDVDRLADALARAVRRHEVLRTRFEVVDGRARQVVGEPWRPVVARVRLDGGSLDRWLRAELADGMSPGAGRLLRCTLVERPGDRPVLVLVLHHLVWDLGSLPVLVEELAGATGPVTQYRSVVEAERARAGSDAERAELAHWARRLAGAPAYPALRPPVAPEPPGSVPLALPDDLLPRLRRLRGVSPFTAAAAALCATLHRWTGADDVTAAIPVANRDLPGRDRVIGPCLNTVVLRSTVDDQTTVGGLLARVRDSVLTGLWHATTPFDRVVEECRPPRRVGWTPYSEVVLNYGAAEPVRFDGAVLRPLDLTALHDYDTKFTLTATLTEQGGRLTGHLSFRGDRIAAADAVEFARVLTTALERLPDVLDERVAEVDLLDPADLERVRSFERPTPPAPATTVPALLADALRTGGAAVTGPAGELTYAELDRRAHGLAGALRAVLPPGDGPHAVALLLPRGPDLVVAMLAAWRAGCAFCPVDPTYPAERVRTVLDDLGPVAVVTDGVVDEPGVRGVPVLRPDATAGPPVEPVSPDPDDVAYVLYTSGTSGRPKGVAVTHRGLAQLVRWHLRVFPLGPADRVGAVASVGFDACQWEHWPALVAGATAVPHPGGPLVAPEVARWIADSRLTQVFLPTPLAEAVLARDPDLPDLRLLLFGGAAPSADPPAGTSFRLCNAYGPTENAVVAAALPLDPDRPRSRTTVGRPVDGTAVHVLDPAGRRCPVGVPGEVHLSGASVALGYWRRPDLTAERFADTDPDGVPARVYRTGDLARWTAVGELEFLGRVDRQVEVRGHRVEPEEVEAVLGDDPAVASAAVAARGGRLVAYVVPRPRAERDGAAVADRLARRLPAFMVPDAVVWLDRIPLTAHGKPDVAALPEPSREAFPAAARAGGAGPGTELERRIARLWSDVLGVGEVGVDDNFFDLGGNSLLLASLHARLEAELGRDVPVDRLFAHPTVRGMAAWARGDRSGPGGPGGGVLDRARRQQRARLGGNGRGSR
ncbi:amino acid adenylation domain-containing protein [Saccharothrix xinjiangensis]|uniref:Amino acid adenylation domain-containing protein n=1 Tax=Saccharothrix xinjiangensis TaxID=204798 RepID=A0ABV9YEJ6_9PSEU